MLLNPKEIIISAGSFNLPLDENPTKTKRFFKLGENRQGWKTELADKYKGVKNKQVRKKTRGEK